MFTHLDYMQSIHVSVMSQTYTHPSLKPGGANGQLKVLNFWQKCCVLCVASLSPVCGGTALCCHNIRFSLEDYSGQKNS